MSEEGNLTILPPAATPPAPTPAPAKPEEPLPTSKTMREQGIDLNTVDWMAKYNGTVGAANQRISNLITENGKLEFQAKDLQGQLEKTHARIKELEGAANQLPDVQKQLTDASTAKAELENKLSKQQVLFGYPHLLNVGPEGGESPLIALAMSSTLDPEALKKQLDALEAGLPIKSVQPGIPPGAPAADQGQGDAASYKKKATAAYNKWIDSHQTDDAAKTEFDENMRLAKQATAQK